MSHCTPPTDSRCHGNHGHDEHHVVSWKLLTVIFAALLFLTFLTVAAIQIDLGALNIVIALAIAVVKGSLVIYYFMHLKWDRSFHALCIILAITFVAIMIGYMMIDTHQTADSIRTFEKTQERTAGQE